ncbi:Na+/H+ antiporter NhaC [Dasania sp. GY-MA-18]|uniref:Na+/H+ antiporter NhaC n=1 Tax=Dasania phycosphaerae TaxID=2950436 RepID=A0A9J6RNF7_9GAMM|nr:MULTISPECIES: Na+/H+ antiporter NhaC [Dasania]MCR8923416.1 Na+/H+ antiporter NhaC [Dasania sp. GY-MA-18]MCZ0865849.1 Na+/H+ antiporter NhaC [Dasania phycosphaerae]MCZ0869573.1 Na+/H+ antiporter NhaC [Dasania phycosphaerae]
MSSIKAPTRWDIAITLVLLVSLLSLSVYFFGEDSSLGPNQIVLTLVAAVVALIGVKNGLCWEDIEQTIISSVSAALMAALILLSVGGLIGSWILSGTVPSMIYYGGLLLSPEYFYVAGCLLCALVSFCVGSSWTTVGTIGVGVMGTAVSLDMPVEITAGAIISGSYFGDKMSPMSDTTNLAPAVTGTDLFTHIRSMMWTTFPSILITLVIFTVLGLNHEPDVVDGVIDSSLFSAGLTDTFTINLFMLLPVAFVVFMAMKKVPALATVLAGTMVGCVFAVLFQGPVITQFVNDASLNTFEAMVKGTWTVLFDGYVSNTGDSKIDSLLSRGGMFSMLHTLWLIIAAMSFGGMMEKTGMLQKMVRGLLALSVSSAALVAKTIVSCIGVNAIASDQYISIVMPGRMYSDEYKKRGIKPEVLSRVLEDGGTITSPLIPWNTCGAFLMGTLGVATIAYVPYCFFNLINPLMSIVLAYLGIGMGNDEPVASGAVANSQENNSVLEGVSR